MVASVYGSPSNVSVYRVDWGDMMVSDGVEKACPLLLVLSVSRSSHSLSTRSLARARAMHGVGFVHLSLSWSALSFSYWCDGTCMI